MRSGVPTDRIRGSIRFRFLDLELNATARAMPFRPFEGRVDLPDRGHFDLLTGQQVIDGPYLGPSRLAPILLLFEFESKAAGRSPPALRHLSQNPILQ